MIIPSGVTLIDYYAFNACTSLSELTLPSSVTSLGVYLLQGCSKVSTVTFLGNRPAEVTDLFAGSSVTSVRYLGGTTGWGTTYGGVATTALPASGTTTDGFSYLFTGTGDDNWLFWARWERHRSRADCRFLCSDVDRRQRLRRIHDGP